MGLLLASILVLVQLLILPGVSFYYDVTPKVLALAVPVAAGLVWFAIRGESWPSSRPVRGLLALLILAALALVLSSALSTHRAVSLSGSTWRRFGALTQGALLLFAFGSLLVVRDAARIGRFLRIFSIAGSAVAAYGIFQYFGFDPLIPPASYRVGEGVWTIVRPPGTLGHASYFGACCAEFVFAGLGLAAIEKTRFWKATGLAAAVLGGCAVVMSGSRAAILGMLAGGIFAALLLRPSLRRAAIAGAIAMAALGAFYVSPAGVPLRARTRWFMEDPLGGARLLLWRDSLRMISDSPLWGRGPETFVLEFPRYQSVELARAYPDFYHESPHNIFLDAATSMGLPGALLLAILAGAGMYAALLARKREPLLASTTGAAFVALLVSGQFSAFTLPAALWFYLLLAMLAAMAWPGGNAGTARAWVRVAAIAAALVLGWYSVRLGAFDLALARAARDLRSGAIADAIQAYADAGRWAPQGASADLWFSRSLTAAATRTHAFQEQLGASQAALETAIRATRTADDRQNAFYHLASLYASRNDAAATEQALRGAIAAAPNWYKPHWMLARVLQLSGKTSEALDEARRAAGLAGGKHAEVADTLRSLAAR